MSLKYRVLCIVALVAASIWALFPRTVVERVKRNGEFVYDTVRRMPLKRGLDLQGGMHLALEVDESKGLVPDKSKAIDNALKVVRNRIDEFGVSEPVVQKAGSDRIIVELPGIDDPRRAQDVVQKSAFLEFQITDKTQALEKSLPAPRRGAEGQEARGGVDWNRRQDRHGDERGFAVPVYRRHIKESGQLANGQRESSRGNCGRPGRLLQARAAGADGG